MYVLCALRYCSICSVTAGSGDVDEAEAEEDVKLARMVPWIGDGLERLSLIHI